MQRETDKRWDRYLGAGASATRTSNSGAVVTKLLQHMVHKIEGAPQTLTRLELPEAHVVREYQFDLK